jgi:hypothetical protein
VPSTPDTFGKPVELLSPPSMLNVLDADAPALPAGQVTLTFG